MVLPPIEKNKIGSACLYQRRHHGVEAGLVLPASMVPRGGSQSGTSCIRLGVCFVNGEIHVQLLTCALLWQQVLHRVCQKAGWRNADLCVQAAEVVVVGG